MTLSEIKELLRIVVDSGVEEVEVEQDGMRIVVRRQQASITVQPALPGMPYLPHMPYGPPGYAPPPQGYAPPPPPAPPAPPAAPAPSGEAMPAAPPAAAPAAGTTIKAPIVGTFYRKPSPESPSFVEVGQHVAKGTVLCIIEAMKLMNEIEAEVSGSIRQVLVENGQPVEYDQPLFVIDAD